MVYGKREIVFTDEIENQGFEEQPLCFLYHCNAGYPFLVPGLRIVMPSIMTGPRDAAAEAGKSRWNVMDEPEPGAPEQVFQHELAEDQNGNTFAAFVNEIDLVCIRPDGAYEAPATVETALRTARKRLSELDDNFHFHTLRHTYTTNLLSNGAAPKDVQELLGHSDVSTTMNVYAHANREGKRNSARLLDKVVGE